MATAKAKARDFKSTFEALCSILQQYEPQLVVLDDNDNYYSLNTTKTLREKPVYFGAAQVCKNYVSYHLMPVYAFPDLLEGMSEPLKRRMQGKSCFNFTSTDPELFKELAQLTQHAFDRYKKEGMA